LLRTSSIFIDNYLILINNSETRLGYFAGQKNPGSDPGIHKEVKRMGDIFY
jgi:hypothetical protein